MPRLSKLGAAALAAFGWTSGSAVSASYLVVAGGGGGGRLRGGGGGAGGFRTGTLSLTPTLSYTVTVGAGGAGSTVATAKGSSGSDSIFSTITSTGGGGGGSPGSGNAAIQVGSNGGSGGGGATDNVTGTVSGAGGSGNTPSTSPSQGSNGGSSTATTQYGAGGGGGASAAGSNGLTSGGAAGGAGTASSITGSSVTYAGGGGGGAQSGSAGAGGAGGGGNGGVGSAGGSNGTANLGGGGGGDGNAGVVGGSGGSGIVIISYAGAQQFGGGVVTSVGGNTIHTFTTSGTLGPITPLSASYLVVAGGGGAGTYGGGGAGGLLSGSGLTIDPSSTYLVTVGAGGIGDTTDTANGTSGTSSSFLSLSSAGGGGGAYPGAVGSNGGSGGGGGGGTTPGNAGGSGNTPSTSPSQGNNGGRGLTDNTTYTAGGGGGGAGAVGSNAASQAGGAGGAGTASSISGTSTTYAGGGGGRTNVGTSAAGGAGGGGQAYTSGTKGGAGTANTGGGGGGGAQAAGGGGNGGSGVVIISYPGSTQQMAGGTVTISGGNVIHTFTSTGYLAPIKYVSNSLRFRSSASAYLSRTPASAGSLTTWTWSGWVKRGTLGSAQAIFSSGTSNITLVQFQANDTLRIRNSTVEYITTQVFRDPSAWYHIVVQWNTTNATAANRVLLYVNGVQVTSFSTQTTAASSEQSEWNKAQANEIGRYAFNGTLYTDGYLTEINFVDGQALTPSSFGTINSYGVWQPITYGGSYGTNGFYLPFTNNTSTTTLGYDFSPQGNNWTPNNISVTAGVTYDSMTDVPTLTSATAANYAVINPLNNSGGTTIADGNLKVTWGSASSRSVLNTMAIPASGKFYAEFVVGSLTNANVAASFGLATASVSRTSDGYGASGAWVYYASNQSYISRNGTSSSQIGSNQTFAAGGIVQIAVDITNSQAWLGYNNVWVNATNGTDGNPSAGTNPTVSSLPADLFIIIGLYANSGNVNFGQRPFAYTPPTGFVALNTYNL